MKKRQAISARPILNLAVLLGLVLALSAFGTACENGGGGPEVGSESHWLQPCEATRDCPSGQSCQCGICTVSCDDEQDCDVGLGGICAAQSGLSDECQSSLFWAESICVSECADEAACDAIDPQLTCTEAGICEREERRMTPVDAGSDTDADGIGDAADAADAAVAACEGPVEPLTVDGPVELDVAIELVDVAGTVTLDGSQMPDTQVSGTERLEVVFEDQRSPAEAAISVGETGPADFATTLTRSTYDVYVKTGAGRYNEDILPVDQRIMVREGWEPRSDERLDIDLEVFEISGTMTLDGGALPDANRARGEVRFERRDGNGTSAVELGATGDGDYQIKLYAGSYDVRYVQQTATPGLPRGGAHVAEAMVVDSDDSFDFDVPTTTVNFDVTIDGQPLPDNSLAGSRGAFVLWDRESELERRIDLGATGAAQLTETMYLETTYDIYFETGDVSDQDALPAGQRVPLEIGLGYQPDVVVDANIASHEVNGEVTVNGAQWADGRTNEARGWVLFVESGRELALSGVSSAEAVLEAFPSAPVTASGRAVFSRTLLGDTPYDVYLLTNDFDAQDALPYEKMARLREDFDPGTDTSLTLDVETIRVTGEVTIDGDELPPSPGDMLPRGRVSFAYDGISVRPGYTSVDVGLEGVGEIDVTLLKGSYDVAFAGGPALVEAVRGLDRYRVETDWVPTDNLSIDLPAVHRVSGSISVDGRTVDASERFGWIRLHPRGSAFELSSFVLYAGSQTTPSALGGSVPEGAFDMEFVTLGERAQDALPPNVQGAPAGVCQQ